ncbi:MAG TPA: hypothetical protein VK698_24860 [Kofleriaceae bacterium]|nr:hypothetical protein [Kofleriaceae bacterium]
MASTTALGCRIHTGWAAGVVLAGPVDSPRVLDRRRLDLVDTADPTSAHVFHRAADLPLPAAAELIDRARSDARARAAAALDAVMADLLAAGHHLRALGMVLSKGRLPTDLPAILRSHPLLHSAEGDLYRTALLDAARHRGLAVTGVAATDLYATAAKQLHRNEADLRRQATELGRSLGKPWAQDQKESAMVAWLALESRHEPSP